MLKKKSTLSINLLSAFIILLCLFMPLMNGTNSWFTSSQEDGVQILVKVGDLKLSVYHTSKEEANLLDPNKPDYIPLSTKVLANNLTPLTIKVANEAQDSIPMYVRFKFELYSRGIEEDELITTELSGSAVPTDTNNKFVLENGYYYYVNASGAEVVLEKGQDLTLFTHFKIPMSEFISEGVTGLTNSDELYIKLYIDAYINTQKPAAAQ